MTSRIARPADFAMSRHERTLQPDRALYRGVTLVHFDSAADVAAHEAVNLLRDKGYLVSGDRLS